jgi:hypothetical protein
VRTDPPAAIVGPVMAMARPVRPTSEIALVRAAAMPLAGQSARSAGAIIAKKVTTEALAYLDLDPLLAVLASAEQTPKSSCTRLAQCPEIDTVADVIRLRVSRYRARGCRQLSTTEREAETRDIAREIERMLTDRYRRHLLK